MAFILPVCAYMATQSKSPILYIIPMVIFAVLGLLMQSRGVTVILAIEVPILLLLLICCSKNKFQSIICTGFLLCIVTILAMSIDLSIFYESLKRYGLDDNGRFRDWQYFYDLYTTNKNFGIGFFGSGGTNHVGPLNKVHSTIFQIWFCTGIVGTCLFAVHYVQRYLLFLTKPNKFKLFMLLSLLAFELYGLIDMTLLMYYLMIALFAVFVACEKETYILCGNTKKGIKVMENNQELNEITTEQSETTQQPAVEETVQQSQKPKRKVKHKLYRYFFKRFFDIILSGLALIILSPVFLVLSIIVRIKHGSPVLFKHPRPGKNNKIFMFAKYRSMIDAYDEKGNLLPDDQRITKFGKMLRKTSLDELPQLWSIFKGDMSIVGPRPKLVQDMVFYNEEQNRRSEVRPGLTGLAQANGRNLNSWAETFKYDIYYVDNCSLWLDIKIIFKTAIKMIKRAEIADTNATADHYHYGKHLLYNNIITQEEYDQKIEESRQIMIANNFVPKISVVNDKIDEQKTAENK